MEDNKRQPKYHVQEGYVSISAWENVSKEGKTFDNFAIQKSYKDKDGNWQKSASFSRMDIANLLIACIRVLNRK